MQLKDTRMRGLLAAATASTLLALCACTPMLAGQMAEAGYNVAKTTLGGPASASSVGADERQKRLQSVLNDVEIGQNVAPVIQAMAESPKEKSGNAFGFTCYEFTGVYSATESAVIVSYDNRIVFYGNSRCQEEMRVEHFKADGKYGVVMQRHGATETNSEGAGPRA